MALRKQINKDVPSESQQMDDDTQEDEDLDDRDEKDELSSSLLSSVSTRGKRRKEREHKTKPKDMTEEEMMDLALRLSEQEASVSALRQQQEEEAVMKAIQESMVNQTQPCPPSQSQSLLPEAEASSLRLCSRRKLLYANGEMASASEERSGTGTKGPGDQNNNRKKKRKRKEGSPLLEMPDLSQTQKICPQASPCSSESPSVLLDSPQSCDSTQIDDDCELRKSPVFPSTGCRAEVHVPRLSHNLLESCRSSGFVLCSQDSSTATQKSPSARHRSPTFPKSPGDLALSESTARPKSPVFSGTVQGDDGELEPTPEYFRSPVFGGNTQHEKLPSACKPTSENSGFMFASSQESFSSSGRPTSCRPKSPVFPRSAGLHKHVGPSERSAFPKSPERGRDGQTEQSHGRSTSPALLCRTERRRDVGPEKSVMSSAAEELRDPSGDENPPTGSRQRSRDPSLRLRQDGKMDHSQDGSFNKSSLQFKPVDSEELNEASETRNWNSETELTSDMTLHWSDEDDDVTPVGSPSPVFPEEKLNHVTAASPGTNGQNCSLTPRLCIDTFAEDQNKHISLRPSTSSTSTCQQQQQQKFSTTEQEPQPISSQGDGGASAPSGEPAGRPTVHYYWGVPFCPRGLDPDTYTQVILAQMEVYEKSLKRAQRCLLRKAEWGEAVLPEPEKSPSPESPAESPQQLVPRRRGLRLRGRKLSETADTPPAETEEEEDKKEGQEEEEERGEEEVRTEREEGQVDTDDCEVCPETQLSDNDSTQDLMIATDEGAELQPKSPERPEVEVILHVDSPAGNEAQEEEEEEMEVDAPADAETEGNKPVGSQNVTEQKNDGGVPDVEEIKDRRLQRSESPELEPLVVPQSVKTNVDCPICQRSFPAAQIEMHAAYCDGEVAVMDEKRPDCYQVSLKPRRKRTRRAAEEPTEPSDAGRNQEKCFICQKNVPLREYSRHTELCIQQPAPKTAAKGNLLSALQQTESRDSEAGPSGSRLQPGDVIDLRDDDDDDEEEEEDGATGSRFRISNSPIRSFTPISEATGCLVDFKKQQQVKKPSQRRR